MQAVARRLFGQKIKIAPNTVKKLNLAAGILLAGQGLAVLLFSGASAVPLYISFLTSDSLQAKLQGMPVTAPAIHEVMQVQVVYLVAAMLLLSAALYVLTATVWRSRYERWLKAGWQPVKWVIATLATGCILAILALLAGLQTLEDIKFIALSAVIAGLLGLALELRAAQRRGLPMLSDWLSLAAALVAAALPWLMIIFAMIGTNLFGSLPVPGYLWWLVGTVFIGMVLFICNAHLRYMRIGKWAESSFGECSAAVIIVLVETVFTWQLFAALLRP